MKRFDFLIGIVSLVFCMITFPLQAQKESEKQSIRIDLMYHQQNDELPVLKVSAKTKKEKKFEPVAGAEINLFFLEETAQGFLGRVKTNNNGEGSLQLPVKFKANLDSLSTTVFIATVTSNDLFENESVEIEITKARIELTLEEEDSIRTIRAKILAVQDSGWIEVPETEIMLVVRRLLSDLSAGDEEFYTTDETGEAFAEYNLTIPGDVSGNIIIGAKIDDHELYGNLTATKIIKWGVPVEPDKSFAKRTLFATRDKTPLWLLIFPNLIIAVVWGFIFYLIYQIILIRRIGKANKSI